MGARTTNTMNKSTTTPAEEQQPSTSKLQGWKARLTGASSRRRESFGEGGDDGVALNKVTSSNAGQEKQLVKSLSSQRNKSKKNWRGSLRNLLPSKEKDGANPQTPLSVDGTEIAENAAIGNSFFTEQQTRAREMVARKQMTKERDGFCRTVEIYDGQVLTVDGKPAYELGNYLGGGVAGVVYEGNRLLPSEEYPVRQGNVVDEAPLKVVINPAAQAPRVSSFMCGDTSTVDFGEQQQSNLSRETTISRKTSGASTLQDEQSGNAPTPNTNVEKMAMDVAIETTAESTDETDNAVFVDRPDAPSRSKHAAKAAKSASASASQWFMEETVAIKILNPVAFRIIAADATANAVVVKEGDTMSKDIEIGKFPMQTKHVWWLVNPNSRNLQTLQRYNTKRRDGTLKKTRDVDRGSPDRGLRLSLVAAYMNSKGELRELPLTRCIEIWGHIPFDATDLEFEDMIEAIEKINAGHAPSSPPSRVPTYDSNTSESLNTTTSPLADAIPMATARTGLYRAAAEARATVFCEGLNAFIAVPAVPPKYLRWLRQRRAATKEIRNMMLIGRHHNVVHLYEVLEYIQEAKSTMFLILELVRGGELFDLISNNSNGGKRGIDVDSELQMRKFFRELASGIHYCHANGIAHRDLKPENLLVHTGDKDTESTLKIADFGLSATFALHDDDTIRDSVASPSITPFGSPMRGDDTVMTSPTDFTSPARSKSLSSNISNIGQHAIQLLTCGNMEDVDWCAPNIGANSTDALPSPLRRMTSVVGSPHYVAPEIILQTDRKDGRKKKNAIGYDGTKADVWSAGVILYAMLYRSLPFGEDLLRCPRYQSFRKWYNEARTYGGRRSSAIAALDPVITADDEAEMLGPHWFFPSHTSAESRDLIVAMLNPNPADRLSIEFVLQHPWLTKEHLSISS